MSVVEHLIDSGLFEELSRQPSNDTVRLGVMGYRHATVYALRGGRAMDVTLSAFRNDTFPDNEGLHEFFRNNGRIVHGNAANEAYQISGQHVAEVVEIIRAGVAAP